MAKRELPKKLDMSAHEQIKTPANKAMKGGIDEIAEDIKLIDIANAYGIIFAGINSVKKWSDFKSHNGHTIFSINESISTTSKDILTEIQKISTAIETSDFEIPFLQHISESIDSFAADAIKYFDTQHDVVIPMSDINLSMNKETANSIGKIADSIKGIDDLTLETLYDLIGVLQQYEKVNLQEIINNIAIPLNTFSQIKIKDLDNVIKNLSNALTGNPNIADIFVELSDSKYDAMLAPAKASITELGGIVEILSLITEDFDKTTSENIKQSFLALYDLATNVDYGFEKVLEAYLIKEDYDLTDSLIQVKSLSDIITNLKEVSDIYDKSIAVTLAAIHNLMTDKDTSLTDIFKALSKVPNITKDTVDSLDGFVLIAEDFKALSQIISPADVTAIQLSIAAMKDTIDGETKDNLNSLIESIANIEVTEDFEKKIAPVIEASDALFNIFSKDFTKIIKNADEMLATFEKLIEIIQKMPEIDPDKNLKKKTDAIVKDMQAYEKNMKLALDAQKKGIIHTKAIISTTEMMSDDIDEVSNSTKRAGNKENEVAVKNLASVIMAMGAMMVIGSMITAKNPSFIRDAYRFGASLVVFVTMVTVPIILIEKLVNNKTKASVEGLGKIVFGIGMSMIIGALFYKWIPGFSMYVKQFIVDMTLFMIGISIPLILMGRLLQYEKSPLAVSKLITRCTVLMFIGALFIMAGGGKFVKAALLFGVALGAFILAVMTPLILLGFLMKGEIGDSIKSFSGLIITCTLVMILGALVVKNKDLITNSMLFGVMLGTFIFLVLAPIWLAAKSLDRDIISVKRISGLILETSIILLIGGLFMTNKKLADGAVKFALLTAAFIGTIVFVIGNAAKKLGPRASLFLHEFNRMIINMSLALMIGGVFMTNKELANGAVKFALLVVGFTMLMAIATRFVSKTFNRRSLDAISGMILAVTAIGLVLMFGTLFVNKFGLKNAIMFATTLVLFTFAVAGVFVLLAHINKEIDKGTFAAIMMAVGIAALGLSLLIMHLAVKNMTWKEIGMMIGATAALVAIFAIVGIPYVAALVAMGSIAIAAMSAALITLSVGFMLVSLVGKIDVVSGAKNIVKGIQSIVWVFVELGALSWIIAPGAIAAAALGVALTSLSVGFLLLAGLTRIKIDGKEISIEDASNALLKGLRVLRWPFVLLGALSGAFVLALASSVSLTASIISLSVAFGLLSAISLLPIVESATKLKDALKKLRWIFVELAAWIVFLPIATASAALLTASILSLSTAFGLMHALISMSLMKDIEIFGEAYKASISIFTQFGLKTLAKLTAGTAIAAELAVSVTAISIAFGLLSAIIKNSEEIKVESINNLGTILNTTISIFDPSKKDSPFAKEKLKILIESGRVVRRALMPMLRVTSEIMNLVKDFSTLMIPDKWDDKGNPVHYKQLETSMFKDAADNIKETVLCLVKGFATLLEDNDVKEFIDDFKNTEGNLLGRLFNGGKSRLSTLVRMTSGITEIVGNVGETIANFASRKVPVEWNNEGKPISYKSLTNDELKNAAQSIVDILSVMLKGVSDFGKTHNDLLDEFANEGGWLSKPSSILGKTIKAAEGIGEIISNTAEGISSYAKLSVPDDWNKDGKAIHYRQLTNQDFIDAGTNIETILSVMINAINDAPGLKKSTKTVDNIADSIMKITKMLSEVAKAIVDYKSLKIPVFKENKLEATGYTTLSTEDFTVFGDNVKSILTALPNAIKEGYDAFKKTGMDVEKLKEITEVFSPMSEMIANIVESIKTYASLKAIPIVDKDGNITKYIEIDLNNDLSKMGDNVGNVLSGMVTAVANGYAKFKESGVEDATKIKDIIDAISPIGNLFKTLIESVSSYADLKIAKYGANGEITGYDTLLSNGDSFDKLFGTISTNISTILVGLVTAVDTAIKNSSLLTDDNYKENFRKALRNIEEMMDPIHKVIDLVKNYTELKFPKGFNKDGKATGYYSVDNIPFDLLEKNISGFITVLPNAINSALIATKPIIEKLTGDDGELNMFKDSFDDITDFVSKNFSNISSFNNKLNELSKKYEEANDIMLTISKNIFDLFENIDKNFIKGKLVKSKRESIIKETQSVVDDLISMIDVMTNMNRNNMFIENQSNGLVIYKERLKDFSSIVQDLASTTSTLVSINNELTELNDTGTEKGAKMISSIKEEVDKISDDNIRLLNKETEGLSKYVKTVNSIDVRKVGSFTKMIDAITKFSNSTGSLEKFTDTLAKKIAVILAEFTTELHEAEKTISNAEKLRKERERTMEKTLDRISTIMNQTLNINVSSSGSSDITTGAYETPKD